MVTLKDYQQRILDELEDERSVALFTGTGSGKTYMSLFRVMQNPTKHLLVVCPARVVGQWEASIRDALPNYSVVDFGARATAKKKNEILKDLDTTDSRAVVISMGIFANMQMILKVIDDSWTVIIDESHRIKELGTVRSPTKITQMALIVGERTTHKIILTATPTQKQFGGYVDYFTQFKFLGCMPFDFKKFKTRYCIEKKMQIPGTPYPIPVITGYKNTDELDMILNKVARRYVPKFTDDDPQMIKIELDKAPSYNRLKTQRAYEDLRLESTTAMRIAKKTLTSGCVMGTDAQGGKHRYMDNDIKAKWVEDFLNDTPETVVIFYKYNVELDILRDICKSLGRKFITLNGANNHKVEDIQTKDYSVVLGQYNACGESIDGLQFKSHIVVYYSMPESSLEYVQSLGRINRIGQEYMPIYYHLVMKGTIDESIYEMTLSKVEFTESVLDQITI